MTIEKGKDWGTRLELPTDAPIVSTDHELAQLFSIDADGSLAGPSMIGLRSPTPEVNNASGLARTVSARASNDELRSGERTALPIDLAVVSLDGEWHVIAGSLVLRRPRWAGVVEGAMNASFYGDWNVAPAGHPNDGRLDVIRAELPIADRLKARKRLPAGTHIPHPGITVRRLKAGKFTPDSRARVWLDHHDFGHVHEVDFAVHPDATTIVI